MFNRRKEHRRWQGVFVCHQAIAVAAAAATIATRKLLPAVYVALLLLSCTRHNTNRGHCKQTKAHVKLHTCCHIYTYMCVCVRARVCKHTSLACWTMQPTAAAIWCAQMLHGRRSCTFINADADAFVRCMLLLLLLLLHSCKMQIADREQRARAPARSTRPIVVWHAACGCLAGGCGRWIARFSMQKSSAKTTTTKQLAACE